MFDIQFTVDMVPVAKGRPRLGRGGRVFTPRKTHEAERQIADVAREVMSGRPPTAVPLMMLVECVFPIPKSYTKKMREEIERGERIPSTVDADNAVKLAGDALNGIVYEDDSQVCLLVGQKRYGQQAQLWIRCASLRGAMPSIRSAQ